MRSKPEPQSDNPTQAVAGDTGGAADYYVQVRQLFREHNRALVNFLRARVPSEQEAQDVAQEAYVKLLQLHEPGAIGFLRGYLFRIAANLTVDHARSRLVHDRMMREQVLPAWFDDFGADGALDTQAITREEFELACEALNELPQKVREAFVWHVVEGYSTSEIARELKVDERTVRKFVTRAMLHCRQCIDVRRVGQGV